MKISLIVPVFNEEDTIPIFYNTVRGHEELKKYDVEIVFINDGSKDATESIINALAVSDKLVVSISFTRNFGKEPAIFAGLERSSGEAVIPIDVDLQDPIEIIPLMVDKWLAGADIVLAKRADRSTDGKLKRKTAEWFYKLHNKISDPKIEENVGDFRLMSRDVVDNIKLMPERNLFMKGVLSWVGGSTDVVEYTRAGRIAGKSKFNGWKLWNLALEGITSFSTFPLRIWTYIGFFVAAVSFLFGAWMIIDKIFWGNPVAGYPSIIVSILFLGGIQLIGIGVLGEYIGRIYIETKQRPRYIVKKQDRI
ncbi:Bactoprenol glucosyl transferase homolog from prophage CPS-53 [Citrobacter werkmanii]|uniref:Bactoprenol glucosyl transferase homolog from prophage CPS-53 n=1 Tax=Citrobacter werkmanii TaxID=67827 RepID=A0A9N8GUR4_9ENTR|nr:glycosyltransferase family 2 protein [Citrobacter werkmanii]CAB5529815.1 Bactoprenol glucosyl transferase homolog from prophage CPS-53 [Citrobacter werkmanii]CAB5551118.1 Bactoprenol glucosyl transferase homolog from prophage CPS-53 [Citrobacter werkmanii]CAB5571041.1 Bactoprenol glucosyl transferase homolog from prophage CPS-53 [Citrobacter werkmanii]CAB5581085.1 Bactoprenol glucosyl transferase homolog from prophage CPS-53 [Citrobacter werkmanii]CAB5586271.1 Bactoprenol glucosyl transfera